MAAANEASGQELLDKVARWYQIVSNNIYLGYADLRPDFPSIDRVGQRLVFNLGSYRLIVGINFETQTLFFKHLFTHDDYMRKEWQ